MYFAVRALYAPDTLDAPVSCLSIFGEISGHTLPIPRSIKIEHASPTAVADNGRDRNLRSISSDVQHVTCRAFCVIACVGGGDSGRSRARSLVLSSSLIIDCARPKIDRGEID